MILIIINYIKNIASSKKSRIEIDFKKVVENPFHPTEPFLAPKLGILFN